MDLRVSERTLYEYLKHNAEQDGDRLCLFEDGRSFTAREVLEQTEAYARTFCRYGIMEGDFVALQTKRSADTALMLYALQTVGAVAVLCHPHLKVEEYLSGTGIDIPLKAIVTKENGSWEIVKGGENISCAKIERAICALPCVRMAAAVGVKHELLGEIPCAVIVPNRSGVIEEEIRNELKKTLLKNEMPERIVFAEELPLLQSGKPDKRRIKRRFESGE